jgi:hypothetical protein
VAAALGPRPAVQRAVVAYDGVFASAPLSIYLAGVPWSGPGETQTQAPVSVSEVDVVGNLAEHLSALPAGIKLISSRAVDGYRVVRFGLSAPWTLGPKAIGARAATLLGPSPGDPSVMVQRPAA